MLKKIFTFPAGLSYEECLRFFKRYEKKNLDTDALGYAYRCYKDEGFYIRERLTCYTFDYIGRLESNTGKALKTDYKIYNYEEQDRTFIGEL